MHWKISPRGIRLLVLVTVYLLVIGCANLADRLVMFPTTGRIETLGATRRAIPFENGELEVWTADSTALRKAKGRAQAPQVQGGEGGSPIRPEACILRFYGNADRADRWAALEAEIWNERRVVVWGVNYPGFGGSTGPARLHRIAPAALAAFDALKAEAGDVPVVVFGASLGTTAALHLAAQRHPGVAGVILHNPPALRQMILRDFGWWNLWLLAGPVAMQIPPELDSVANARAARAPGIFLLAEKDEVVMPRYHRLVADAYAGEKRVIVLKDANHNSPIDGTGLAEFHGALDWLLPRSPEGRR